MRRTRKNKGGNITQPLENQARILKQKSEETAQETKGFLSGLFSQAKSGIQSLTNSVGGKSRKRIKHIKRVRKTRKGRYSKKTRRR